MHSVHSHKYNLSGVGNVTFTPSYCVTLSFVAPVLTVQRTPVLTTPPWLNSASDSDLP